MITIIQVWYCSQHNNFFITKEDSCQIPHGDPCFDKERKSEKCNLFLVGSLVYYVGRNKYKLNVDEYTTPFLSKEQQKVIMDCQCMDNSEWRDFIDKTETISI